jgi:hypothetical protein
VSAPPSSTDGGTVQNTRGTTTKRRCLGSSIAAASLLIPVAAPVSARSDADERAAKRVEAMASFLAKAPRLSVTADSTYDVVQDSGQKIEFGEQRVMTLRRPDRARIETIHRDGTRRGLVFDGKQLAVFDIDQKVYATAAKTGTTDAAFGYYKNDLNMRLPLSDLLASDLRKKVSDMLGSARLVSEETVNGVATDHVALRGDSADLQLWIARTGDPLPQRLVITYRLAEGQPRYEANFSGWNLAPDVPDSVFTFTPAEGAQEIPFLVPRPEKQP